MTKAMKVGINFAKPFLEQVEPFIKKYNSKAYGVKNIIDSSKSYSFYKGKKKVQMDAHSLVYTCDGIFLPKDDKRIAIMDRLVMRFYFTKPSLFKKSQLRSVTFSYGVKFDNNKKAKMADLKAKLSNVEQAMKAMDGVLVTYAEYDKPLMHDTFLNVDFQMKGTQFLGVVRNTYIINTNELHDFISYDEALSKFEKNVIDKVLPQLEAIYQNIAVAGISLVK